MATGDIKCVKDVGRCMQMCFLHVSYNNWFSVSFIVYEAFEDSIQGFQESLHWESFVFLPSCPLLPSNKSFETNDQFEINIFMWVLGNQYQNGVSQ